MYLARFSSNWADEMDLDGFMVLEDKEPLIEAIKEALEEPQEIYWGTNEYTDYQNANQLLSEISFTEITDEEAKVLKKFFKYGAGCTTPLEKEFFQEIVDYRDRNA